ncbi:MAG: nucleotidyl transferase AbiEii/AbiGii toxin family protein [Bacteroidales bacterium]|nr:nucleotidyl transferase AbiEii/AbiGii toxin family protein [Bacteroidales bacterium]
MLSKYEMNSQEQATRALREVMQEIALAGLYRGDFFSKAAFYGGTCLRIFHQLPRFSEDLDFSLLADDPTFSLAPYFNAIKKEFDALGMGVIIKQKNKTAETAIESAFLKNTTQLFDLALTGPQIVNIKFEVDTQPPLGFQTEEKLLLEPFSFYVKCFSPSDLFAGKIHALIFRKWKNRVKGRDWFDFEWYIRKGIPLNLDHFNRRAVQGGNIEQPITKIEFLPLLKERIKAVDINSARQDIRRFVTDAKVLDIWSSDYFLTLADKVKVITHAD